MIRAAGLQRALFSSFHGVGNAPGAAIQPAGHSSHGPLGALNRAQANRVRHHDSGRNGDHLRQILLKNLRTVCVTPGARDGKVFRGSPGGAW
ncbi:MAG: hypothetical protein WKF77_21950 [Planctomycetaceae bacterium]